MPPLIQPHPLAILMMMALFGSVVGVWALIFVRILLEKSVLPPATPRVVPWGAGSVLGSILVWFAMQAAVGLAYRLAAKPPGGDAPAAGGSHFSPTELMGLSALGNVAAVILIPLLLRASSGTRLRDFGIEARGLPRRVLEGILAYPLLAPCIFGLMLVCVAIWGKSSHPLQEAMMDDRSPRTVALLVFAGSVMAPLAEELLFRGVLLGWLTKLAIGSGTVASPTTQVDWLDEPNPFAAPAEGSFLAPIPIAGEDAEAEPANLYVPPNAPIVADPSPRAASPSRLIYANVAVSAVFALLHGAQWPAPVPLFVLSMALGFLYQRTGSLIGPIALHMTFNGVSTLMLFLVGPVAQPPDQRAPVPVPGPAIHRVVEARFEFGGVGR